MKSITTIAARLRELATSIRDNPAARDAIADGFDLIAESMYPCIDGNGSVLDFPNIPCGSVNASEGAGEQVGA